ncbi:hypothetical protein SLEP1_g5846 [Rubroshorea leprosula]|uniref:Uncharacterized protein n=1 Tax=Rubroshorea leprosula TaxID=152421 RepID=A0AAV5I247_9ROSI|nr:hypothetical protein SLEP1_g5846 [Rubroshorea leprosula]
MLASSALAWPTSMDVPTSKTSRMVSAIRNLVWKTGANAVFRLT